MKGVITHSINVHVNCIEHVMVQLIIKMFSCQFKNYVNKCLKAGQMSSGTINVDFTPNCTFEEAARGTVVVPSMWSTAM